MENMNENKTENTAESTAENTEAQVEAISPEQKALITSIHKKLITTIILIIVVTIVAVIAETVIFNMRIAAVKKELDDSYIAINSNTDVKALGIEEVYVYSENGQLKMQAESESTPIIRAKLEAVKKWRVPVIVITIVIGIAVLIVYLIVHKKKYPFFSFAQYQSIKAEQVKQKEEQEKTEAREQEISASRWECANCGTMNSNIVKKCVNCGNSKDPE